MRELNRDEGRLFEKLRKEKASIDASFGTNKEKYKSLPLFSRNWSKISYKASSVNRSRARKPLFPAEEKESGTRTKSGCATLTLSSLDTLKQPITI